MSSSNRVRLSIIREVTPGVTPSTPAMQTLRWLSEGLNLNNQNVQSDEIRDDRSKGALIQVGYDVGGDVSFEMSSDSFNILLEAAFCAAFTGTGTRTLTNGTTVLYHTVIKQFMDLAGTQMVYTGLAVDQMTLTFKKRAKVEGSFSFVGMKYDSVLPAGATFLPATTDQVWNTSSHVTSILMDGVPMTTCIDTISLNVKNNLRPTTCVGNKGATKIEVGDFDVSGSIDLYFNDMIMFNKYEAGTPFSLLINVEDDTGKQSAILLPQLQFETLKATAGGGNQDVMATGTYKASKGAAAYQVQWSATP